MTRPTCSLAYSPNCLMKHVTFRFYAELNDFLLPERRHHEVVCPFQGRVSVKDLIESLGVPHPEVDLILANGQSVDFSYLVCDEDRISVYPVFESFDITPLIRLRPTPLREPRFVLDTHLGRLAAHLRLAGFDALYRNDYQDAELVEISTRQQRILLSRDQALLKCGALTHAYYVRETRHARQLVEVLRRFDLCRVVQPFRRCLRCNDSLHPVAKNTIVDRLPPRTRQEQHDFHECPSCRRIYWKGSHYTSLVRFLQQAMEEADDRLDVREQGKR